MSLILELQNIRKTYHHLNEPVHALKGVSLGLKAGEILAVMGSSGSGKSSLLNIMGALDQPNSGEILLEGRDQKFYCKEPQATKIRQEYIGFIFQNYNLINDLRVYENIQLPLLLGNMTRKASESRVHEIIEQIGLKDKIYHYPNQLSGGQQQRVAIGRALVTKPKILLADEPTGNLDYHTATEIIQLICKVSRSEVGSTILVTHDPRIASYADRVIFLLDGQIQEELRMTGDKDFEKILKVFERVVMKSPSLREA